METSNRFPAAAAIQRRASAELQASSGLRTNTARTVGPVALVVDDEPFVRALVAAVLRRRGWSVIEAPDGPSALAVAPQALDLLVTDYEMPAISGVTVAEQLRLRDDRLPVLMLSGRPDAAARMRGLRGPRTAFVGKPFPVEELVATIRLITA
jgi:DNA-binding response OmpR family regulator